MIKNKEKFDCGYAWVVVEACFVINFIMAGLARSAGVMYVALIDIYGVSREIATTPFSIRYCVRNLSGPVVGALGQHFGIRPIVFLGGLVCGLGGILSALATDVTWITLAWGGVHGLGYGMCNLIHVIVINRYFKKYKGLALGVCLSGDCFGTFLLPLLLEFLLPIYNLDGTFLILAGISLNVVPAAMLLCDPPWEGKTTHGKNYADSLVSKKGIINESIEMDKEGYSTTDQVHVMEIIMPTIVINNEPYNEKLSETQSPLPDSLNMPDVFKKNDLLYSDIYFSGKRKISCLNDAPMFRDFYRLEKSTSLKEINKRKKRLSFNINLFSNNSKNRCTSISSVLSCPSHVGKCMIDTHVYLDGKTPRIRSSTYQSVKDETNDSNQNLNPYTIKGNCCISENVSNSDQNVVKSTVNCTNNSDLIFENNMLSGSDKKEGGHKQIEEIISIQVTQPNALKSFF